MHITKDKKFLQELIARAFEIEGITQDRVNDITYIRLAPGKWGEDGYYYIEVTNDHRLFLQIVLLLTRVTYKAEGGLKIISNTTHKEIK